MDSDNERYHSESEFYHPDEDLDILSPFTAIP